MDWRGKTVLITGAAGGLGRALCRSFGERGAKIVAVDLDREALSALKNVEPICCDLTDEQACREALAGRPVDVVINNAGITHFSRFAETEPETIRRVMAVNFFGAVNVAKAVLPVIKESKGTIVALSSVAGFSPLFGRTGYSASKHAMEGFFKSLRSELHDDGVNVMIVCPSFIATQEATRANGDDLGAARPGSASQTSGKPLNPEDVAEEIVAGVERGRRLLVVGRLGKLSYWVNKIAPKVFERLMIQKMKPEFETARKPR
jgi:NAD(P)-dependent dehydrogenase (short-subunit alcohol dehydrogenase family)